MVSARDVVLASDTDSATVNLLVRLFNDSSVRDSIAQGLTHDFAPDYDRVLGKAKEAIAAKREGDFLLSAQVDKVETGRLEAVGQGLFLPIRASGKASIAYRPR